MWELFTQGGPVGRPSPVILAVLEDSECLCMKLHNFISEHPACYISSFPADSTFWSGALPAQGKIAFEDSFAVPRTLLSFVVDDCHVSISTLCRWSCILVMMQGT